MKTITLAATAAALLAVPALAVQQAPARPGQALTLAELQTRAQARFARTDRDGDGFITREEIQAQAGGRVDPAERRARREQRQARRAERLARLDTDRDGTISRAERQAFRAARGGGERSDAQRAARQERRAERQASRGARPMRIGERRFARLDADGDARVSFAEVAARLERRFQRIDSNGDGALTRDERRAARERRQARRDG